MVPSIVSQPSLVRALHSWVQAFMASSDLENAASCFRMAGEGDISRQMQALHDAAS